jgi:hypothetical protein
MSFADSKKQHKMELSDALDGKRIFKNIQELLLCGPAIARTSRHVEFPMKILDS